MAAGTVVGVAVCVTALVASLSAVSLREQQRTTVRHLREVQQSERNAQLRLVDAKLAQARAGGHSREPGQRLAAWQAIAEAAGLAGQLQVNDSLAQELRNEAIALLSQPDVRLESQWEGWPKGSLGLAFDADLKRYAYSDEQGNITICSAPDGRQLATLSADGVSAAAPQLRFSPDGRYLLARHHRRPNQSCNFRLWDWQNGKIGLEHGEQIESFVGDFSPDGQRFVVATPDGMLTFYETATVNVLQRIELGTAPRSIAFDSKGEKLGLIGAGSGKVQVLALPSGEVLHTFSPDSFALNVAWHSSGALLAVGCNNGTIEIWDATTGERHGMLHGHRATAAFIEFMPDGDTLLSYAWDGTSRLWDVWACREVVQFEGEAIRFSKNGLRLASRAGNRVQLWELRPSTVYRPLPSRPTFHPNVDVTADGRWLVQATENRFRVWDLENNQAVANVPLQGATAVLFHPTRSELYTSSYSGLYRWPWQIQDDCLHIGPPGKLPIGGLVSDITFDGDGHTLAVAMNGSEGGATVLDLRAETNEPQHFGHPWAIWIAMSPDGRFVASGPHHGLGVKVWQIDNGKLVRELVTKDRPVTVTFSPDGRWLVTGTVGELLVWEVGSWQFAQRIPRQPADGCGFAAFSNDGEILAVTESTSIVQLLATRDWRTLARLTPPDRNAVIPHFTPDSTQLIVAGGGVHVWDLRNLRDQLAGIGLDWDATPYPAKADTPAPQPMRVEVDIGELADATASQ
ncbi:MAG TPA: hypothetical protein VHK01_01735 [Lacipirellulaceae bacterium]|nr:hypothetical protein [Lacipirellulaceae bacterium]